MSFEDRLYESMTYMLRDRDVEVEKVIGWDDRTVYSGGCSTCAFEYAVVDIYYINAEGTQKTFTYNGEFGELMRSLR